MKVLQLCKKQGNQLYRDWTGESPVRLCQKIDKTAKLATVEDQASLEALVRKLVIPSPINTRGSRRKECN